MSALKELIDIVERIRDITVGRYNDDEIDAARKLPIYAATQASYIEIGLRHGSDAAQAEVAAQAETMKAEIKARMIADAEIRRDQKLLGLSEELERLRSALPGIAMLVSIETGQKAMIVREEARHGPT